MMIMMIIIIFCLMFFCCCNYFIFCCVLLVRISVWLIRRKFFIEKKPIGFFNFFAFFSFKFFSYGWILVGWLGKFLWTLPAVFFFGVSFWPLPMIMMIIKQHLSMMMIIIILFFVIWSGYVVFFTRHDLRPIWFDSILS